MPVTVEVPAGQVVIEQARQRAHRRRVRLAVVVALAITGMLVAALVTSSDPPSGRTNRPGARQPAPTGLPAELVAWTTRFRLVVLDTRTGSVIRTLATDVTLDRGLPTMSVAPGGLVYFDDAGRVGGQPVEVIRRIAATGGPSALVAVGRSPAISPDGRFLAYVSPADRLPERVVVRTLATGRHHDWSPPDPAVDVGALSWSSDSRQLSVSLSGPPEHWVRLPVSPSGTPRGAQQIRLPERASWAGFLAERSGLAVLPSIDGQGRLVVVNPASGAVTRDLGPVPGALFTANAVDGPETSITVDATGKFVLVTIDGTAGRGHLYRWTVGTHQPIPIAADIGRAAWLK